MFSTRILLAFQRSFCRESYSLPNMAESPSPSTTPLYWMSSRLTSEPIVYLVPGYLPGTFATISPTKSTNQNDVTGMLSNYFESLNKGGAETAGQHPMNTSDSTTTTNSILQLIPHTITTTKKRRTGHQKEQKTIMTRRNNHILWSILIITLMENPSNYQEGTDSKVFYYDIHIRRKGTIKMRNSLLYQEQ